jgi:hypothetical protein
MVKMLMLTQHETRHTKDILLQYGFLAALALLKKGANFNCEWTFLHYMF